MYLRLLIAKRMSSKKEVISLHDHLDFILRHLRIETRRLLITNTMSKNTFNWERTLWCQAKELRQLLDA